MRAVIQRVERASVSVEGEIRGQIGAGFLVLIGVEEGDGDADFRYIAEKVPNLRVFEDEQGKMNRSLLDVGGELLAVSQFTLLGDARGGRRPSFITAARPETADPMYERLVADWRARHPGGDGRVRRAHEGVAGQRRPRDHPSGFTPAVLKKAGSGKICLRLMWNACP